MDLLKMALRLSPYLEAELVADCLEIALAARSLDVAASPYDATDWGLPPVSPKPNPNPIPNANANANPNPNPPQVCIETAEGRQSYRRQQEALMRRAAPVRAAPLLALTLAPTLTNPTALALTPNPYPLTPNS